jgi:hypothetical protein
VSLSGMWCDATGVVKKITPFRGWNLGKLTILPRMEHRARAAALVTCVLVASIGLLHAAKAQNLSYDELIEQALAAYQAEQWDEARRLFELAHGLEPTARTLRTIGMSAFNQRDYITALQNLEAALFERRRALTEEQRADVSVLVTQANAQVGRFRLRISPEGARLMVDGKSPALSRDGELVLAPGRHEVEVSKADHPSITRRLEVQAGDRTLVELVLPGQGPALAKVTGSVAGAASGPGRFPGARPVDAGGKSSDDAARETWGVIAVATGAATLLASGIVTAFAVKEKSALDEACPEQRCLPSNHDQVDRYDTLRMVAGVTFAIGLLGAGTGAYLLLGADERAAPVQAVLSPSFVGVRGRL